MTRNDSAIATPAVPTSPVAASRGIVMGAVGVLAFSFTLPFTRVAVAELDPLVVAAGRAVVAAVLAGLVLAATRSALPRGAQWARLAVVAVGVVVGFPLLTSLALTTAPAAHGAVVVGLLPAATAVAAVVRTGERPGRRFWAAATAGALAVVVFTAAGSGGLGGLHLSDLLLLGAVALGALGYAEGGMLSRELGAWQTICWALLVALPAMAVLTAVGADGAWPTATPGAWAAFAYLSAVSMFLGFFAWYRGLAIGPMTQVSQVQLVQPVLTLVWSAALLGEPLGAPVLLGAAAVIACAATAVRSRTGSRGGR